MHNLVDKIMIAAAEAHPILGGYSDDELRRRVSRYIALLWSAGKRDPDELADLGLGYLRTIIDGPNSTYTGC
jgi:hypothetical protein